MKTSQTHLPSLLSSLLFIFATLLFISVALLMGITALSTLLAGQAVEARQTIIVAVAGFEALLLLTATFISVQKFLHQPSAEKDASFSISILQIVIGLIITGAAIFVGDQISMNETINWLVLPILTIVVVILPIFVLLGLGIGKIPLGTRWQTSNIFGIGMTLAPLILIFLESLALVIVVIFIIAVVISQPGLPMEMERFTQQLYILGPESEAAMALLAPYITKPAVIAVALGYFALLIPLLEEIFKPLGVWLFSRQLTTRAQGFALGALSGAAYALIETLGVSAQTTEWASLLLSRIGTGTLHITTSALMGAAIVGAIHERRYLRLLATYFLAVFLHGLWNALAILYSFSNITNYLKQESPLSGLEIPASIGMSVLAVVLLLILIFSNHRMRATITPVSITPLPAEENISEGPA